MHDLLRMTPTEVNEHNYESKKYRESVINELSKESGLADLDEILLFVVEKYHPDLYQRAPQGRKLKWSRVVCALLAVEIQHRDSTVENAIDKLLKHSMWKKLIPKNSDGFESFKRNYKEGRSFKSEFNQIETLYLRLPKEEWDEIVANAINNALREETK
jgi:hypothetical protein